MRAALAAPAVVVTMLAACTDTPRTPSRARIVILPSKSLVISQVRADIVDRATIVQGHVARRALQGGPIPGHVHVEAVSGPLIVAWADARWNRLARRRFPASVFQARLPDTAFPLDQIRVSHVSVEHGDTSRPGNSL